MSKLGYSIQLKKSDRTILHKSCRCDSKNSACNVTDPRSGMPTTILAFFVKDLNNSRGFFFQTKGNSIAIKKAIYTFQMLGKSVLATLES